MGCLLQAEVGSQPEKWGCRGPISSTSQLKATLSHFLMEFVPILILKGTKSLLVLYKYFILFQQQIS